jgi:hypothetical protein
VHRGPENLTLVYAADPLPMGASVFLAGPTGRAVLGCPADCPDPERNRYLIWLARRHGVPVTGSLPATVASALALIRHMPG